MFLRLTIPPRYKLFRLCLPVGILIAGLMIFFAGMIRTYHMEEKAENIHEERFLRSNNERTEWIGFVLMFNAVFAAVAVFLDKPLPFKISVFLSGCCFVICFFGIVLDIPEFSQVVRKKRTLDFLQNEGHACETSHYNFTYSGAIYKFKYCSCSKDDIKTLDFYSVHSCQLLIDRYRILFTMMFGLILALTFCLFIVFSFILILKRISQITTALHLDEKPLSEDFGNISGDLYIDSA